MINTIIIEDELRSARTLNKMLLDYCPEINVIGIASNIKEGKLLIESGKPDLVFLDIQLPDGDSFTLLNILHNIDFMIIFTTAFSDYALKAIKCSALDYLLKPVNIDELIIAVDKYKLQASKRKGPEYIGALNDNIGRATSNSIRTIGLSTVNEILFVATDDIIRLEAASNYTHFHIEGSSRITVSHTLKYYEELLDPEQFMRVHQSSMINLRKVRKYIRGKVGMIEMSDGCKIDVSSKKKDEFLKVLNSR
jgi:two-component system, LytTR family, response regulator